MPLLASLLSDPTTVWTFIFVGITFALYLFIGWRSRVAETQGFYVAGRGVPAVANGAATAADWMSAASFMGMAGIISYQGYDGSVFLMGWTGGYVLLALLLAPYLRKFGKYTVPDFVGERYYSETARVVAAICAIFVSLTYVAGQMRGVGIVFSRFLEVDVTVGVIIGMFIVAFFAVLGGMKGITWTQVVQYFVLILAFLIPAIALSRAYNGNPLPQVSVLLDDIATQLNGQHEKLGFADYTQPFSSTSKLDIFCYTFALMAGTAGLPHVIVRFYTVNNVRAARFSAGWALLFIAILYTTAPALAMFARYNMLSNLHESELDHIEVTVTVKGEEPEVTKHEFAGLHGDDLAAQFAKIDAAVKAQADHEAAVAAAKEAGEEPPTAQTTEIAYRLNDRQGEAIKWVNKWQKTDLVVIEDKNRDGNIEMFTMVDPPPEAMLSDEEVQLINPLRDDVFRYLDGAQVEGKATATVDGKPRQYLALKTELGTRFDWAEAVKQAQLRGDLKVQDKNGDGQLALGDVYSRNTRRSAGFAEAKIDRDTIVLSTPEVARLSSWVIALVATGGLAAALSTAAGLLLVISSSIAHDLYIHFVEPDAPEARRVMVGRLMIGLAIFVAGYFGINPPDYVAATVALAFGLAASSFFPVIFLGIFDKRANREGAIAGMIVGILFTAIYIIGTKAETILGLDEPLFGRFIFGISPEGIGAVGCLLNFIVMIVVSRLTPPPPMKVQALVEDVRVPKAGAAQPE